MFVALFQMNFENQIIVDDDDDYVNHHFDKFRTLKQTHTI